MELEVIAKMNKMGQTQRSSETYGSATRLINNLSICMDLQVENQTKS
jgi:hypothetical protein